MDLDKKNLQESIAGSRDLLKNNDISVSEAVSKLNDFKASAAPFLAPQSGRGSFSPVKSLLSVFNINNFSDFSVLIFTTQNGYKVIDSAGDETLLNFFTDLINEDNAFYVGIEKLQIQRRNYNVFSESMDTGDFVCTVIAFSESSFFRPTSFHILCDIIMDLVKFAQYKPSPVYCDYFENISVEINSFISKCDPGSAGSAYLFIFDQINNFFKNTGFSRILEISSDIEVILSSIFGEKSGIFRISLSMFLVIADESIDNEKYFQKCRERKIDFNLRGIVLPYTCSTLELGDERSAYSILGKIIKSDNRRLL